MRVWLNIDLGELDQEPEELYQVANIANVACGGHAGDASIMLRACQLARSARTLVYAHPSYPDRETFGRVSLKQIPLTELQRALRQQLEALCVAAGSAQVAIDGVKPHGALYHDCSTDPKWARCLLDCVSTVFGRALTIVGAGASALEAEARAGRHPFLREAFADRGYDARERLLSRAHPDALLSSAQAARDQAIRLARTGRFDTLCVHGDGPNALAIARGVRDGLEEAGLLRQEPLE